MYNNSEINQLNNKLLDNMKTFIKKLYNRLPINIKEFLFNLSILIAGVIVIAPAMLVFNQQPDTEPQKWYLNLIGLVYIIILILFVCSKNKK